MLPTFVIGLREGLEAALIVSIVATFLRRNGAPMRGMWIGVLAGIGLSIAVGVVLDVVEQSLPQRQQEGMETVIGLVAVFFVTGMVLWMRKHARYMKRDLEQHATEALKSGTTTALVVMAFLAVLREGFETAVFLLATFRGASSAPLAIVGAVLGLAVAVALGFGIYRGGVRLNLQKFFSITGLFLILVAAGLVLSAFRTGHEAGWVTIGQQRTVDLSWLAPNGSIRSALVSGVLGIPRDPRVVEVLAWAAYLVPLLTLVYWPAKHRPGPVLAQRLRLGAAVGSVVAAVLLAVLVPLPNAQVSSSAPVQGGGSARIVVHGDTATLHRADRTYRLSGAGADHWKATRVAGSLPATLDVDTLFGYTGGRAPVGLDVHAAPGPYDAKWSDKTTLTATTHDGGLVDAAVGGRVLLILSGGGLTSPRVVSVDGATWRVSPGHAATTTEEISAVAAHRHDRTLWKYWVPGALVLLAVGLLLQALRLRVRRTAPAPTAARRTDSLARTESRVP